LFREDTEMVDLRASTRRLSSRWQTCLHERRLNKLAHRQAQFNLLHGKRRDASVRLESSTHAGSAVIAQIASSSLRQRDLELIV
jgi:hypothetical protein